jgi:hypothetical protein
MHLVAAPMIGDGKTFETARRPAFADAVKGLRWGQLGDGVFYVVAEGKDLDAIVNAPGVLYRGRILPAGAALEQVSSVVAKTAEVLVAQADAAAVALADAIADAAPGAKTVAP